MSPLQHKRDNEVVPQYSLTGDLLSFLRCPLQYRYHSGSSLPPSRPVQQWFGEFIHGIMEAAYRTWRTLVPPPVFPWPATPTPYREVVPAGRIPADIGTLGDIVEGTLRAQGKNPRSRVVRESAYKRAALAVNEFGPHLFPLISSAEEKVIGTRVVPPAPGGAPSARAKMYELHGVIDVLTDMQLTGAPDTNIIKRAIQDACPGMAGHFEVIVDYKGSRRPPTTHAYSSQGEWQVQTYAWLRMKQPNSLPVLAGVLLYINELSPGSDDIRKLQHEIRGGQTDVFPVVGTNDAYLLNAWRPGNQIPLFSDTFRWQRAIKVVPVDAGSRATAAANFDGVVLNIEQCVGEEARAGDIIRHWNACGDEETCNACDFRHFCPSPEGRPRPLQSPDAP